MTIKIYSEERSFLIVNVYQQVESLEAPAIIDENFAILKRKI